tara:strand:- start:5297 stop:7636 length:2340 start_codon:yes stop_codon:yes gene_type:complete
MASKKNISKFYTKGKTLSLLKNKINKAVILDLILLKVSEYKQDKTILDREIAQKKWGNIPLIIRSSSSSEDNADYSNAGKFLSLSDVKSLKEIKKCVNKVIKSYPNKDSKNEVLIQPYLSDVGISGVMFTRDPSNNSPYIKINYDSVSGSTDSITSGLTNDSEIFYYHKKHKLKFHDFRDKLIDLCFELESIFENDSLDIEFAIDKNNNLYLLQVRPLIINAPRKFTDLAHYKITKNISKKLGIWTRKHPYLHGDKGIYGVMPDWNPAEIIGRKPKPLALSLYRELVTNDIWAYQRDNYGYKNLRSFPLIIEIEGCPYIDVRVSFNSFIPKKLDSKISNKLVNYYLQKLRDNPHLHDKVEFDIIFSCTTLTLDEDISDLKEYNFNDDEIEKIKLSLCEVTNKIINNTSGLWKKDLKKISELQEKHETIVNSDLNNTSKIYWLIEDCKRYGTLPFAGLARTAFIAISILKSLVIKKILSKKDYNYFLLSLETISTKISEDFKNISRKDFIKKYGHLRPGTYDILTKAYQEDFDNYFHWNKDANYKKSRSFSPTKKQSLEINKLLKNYKIDISAQELFIFIKKSIEAREYAKFIFTKNINSVLKIFSKICDNNNITRSDSAYTHISSIMSLDSSATNYMSIVKASIKRRKDRFDVTKSLNLPHIITDKDDVYCYFEDKSVPNYITQNIISGSIVVIGSKNNQNISGKIILIERADPGYDWIFSHNIIGLVTKYGGANSHMAIRSGELNIPAAIGVGSLYDKLITTEVIEIDAVSKRILVYR